MTIGRTRHMQSKLRAPSRKRRLEQQRKSQRQLLLEQLEDRRVMAGAILAGIQPNNSDLLSLDNQGTNIRSVAPRQITLRFDENQQLDPATLNGVRITRSGFDGVFGNANDQVITPGFISVGTSPNENEIVVRFAENLPDDLYQIEIFGAGSAAPLRNLSNQAYIPTLTNDNDGSSTKDTIRFELDLGPQVVAVVPQPVTRNSSGAIEQARNQIQVYFNDDDLFVEDDDLQRPTQRSAENADFYQLIFTADTVRNTDDIIVKPQSVSYDAVANVATLTFSQPLDMLLHPDTGALIGPGTFRLRIGTDEAAPLPPQRITPGTVVSTDFNTNDAVVVQFTAVRPDEQDIALFVTRHDRGGVGTPAISVIGNLLSIDLDTDEGNGGLNATTAQQVVDAINTNPLAHKLMVATINQGIAATKVGDRDITYSPLVLTGLGSSFDTASDLTDQTDAGPVLVVTGSGVAFVDGHVLSITDTTGQTRVFNLTATYRRL